MRTLFAILLIALAPCAALAQAVDDIDGDGLLNTEEDRNGDGIVNTGETDPNDADTDGGGEADGSETQAGRDPFDRRDDMTYDLDNDGLTNAEELSAGTKIDNPDTDEDGLNDKDDPFPLQKSYTKDTDSDGLPDEYEEQHQLQIDKRSDADEDTDGDGLTNLQEFVEGTDLENADTDGDGIPDGEEVADEDADPLENACLNVAAPGEVLHDLDEHWSKPYVLALQRTKAGEGGKRIVEGYWTDEGAMFRPDQNISRFELLKLALLSTCATPEEHEEGTVSFTDIPRAPRPRESEDRTFKRQVIYTAEARGIVEGYPDGTFLPNAPVNRAEALKILLAASKLEPFDDADYAGRFSDIDDAAWYAPFLHVALSHDFLEGYDDGTFRPEQPITRAEAAKLVLYILISNPRINGYVVPVEGLDL